MYFEIYDVYEVNHEYYELYDIYEEVGILSTVTSRQNLKSA